MSTQDIGSVISRHGLANHGLRHYHTAYWNLHSAQLIQTAIKRGEGELARGGAFVALTGDQTGRSPNDKFIVEEPATRDSIWWGKVNVATTDESYRRLYGKVTAYLQDRDLFVQDLFAGADPEYRLKVRVVSENAWHALFARNMFIEPGHDQLADFAPDFTVLHAPHLEADPETDGTNSSTFIVVNFSERTILIGGTRYAGEIKKSIFSILNYLLPERDVLPMHCSANIGEAGDTAIFFGHRQDHTVGGPAAAAHRRRRARLVGRGRLQLRGRLLRQGDPPVPGGRAGDLRHHQPLRHDPGERGDGPADRRARPG